MLQFSTTNLGALPWILAALCLAQSTAATLVSATIMIAYARKTK